MIEDDSSSPPSNDGDSPPKHLRKLRHRPDERLQRDARRVKLAVEHALTPLPPAPLNIQPDPHWLNQQVRVGMLPPDVLSAEEQQCLRKIDTKRKRQPVHPASQQELGTLTPRRLKLEEQLDEASWRKVYELYRETSDHKAIAAQLGLKPRFVSHLIDYGVHRLALPPIREHAVDLVEVNKRLHQLGASQEQVHTPDAIIAARESVTDRATQEAVAARGLLETTTKAVKVSLRYVDQLMQQLDAGQSKIACPEAVTASMLETISKLVNNLNNAMDKAVRLSLLTQGKPESTIALQVAQIVAFMTPEETRGYLETKQLPQRLLLQQAAQPKIQ